MAKSFHVAAYTFHAAIVCPNCVLGFARSVMRKHGMSEIEIKWAETDENIPDVGYAAAPAERALPTAARLLGVNLDDYYSFNSDNFPKVVFYDQLEESEYCDTCGEQIV